MEPFILRDPRFKNRFKVGSANGSRTWISPLWTQFVTRTRARGSTPISSLLTCARAPRSLVSADGPSMWKRHQSWLRKRQRAPRRLNLLS